MLIITENVQGCRVLGFASDCILGVPGGLVIAEPTPINAVVPFTSHPRTSSTIVGSPPCKQVFWSFRFQPSEIFHTATLPIFLHDIGGQSDGSGDFELAKPRLCNPIKNASTPSFIYNTEGFSTFSHLGASIVGIGWPTLRGHVYALGCFIVINSCDFCSINSSA